MNFLKATYPLTISLGVSRNVVVFVSEKVHSFQKMLTQHHNGYRGLQRIQDPFLHSFPRGR